MSTKPIEEILKDQIFPGNAETFNELNKSLISEEIVGFTGAGVSAQRYPTWSRLLKTLVDDAASRGLLNKDEIDECERQLQADPLELASSLEEVCTRQVFRARLAKAFSNPNGETTDCQRAIAELKLKGIVTLNYDNGHEIAYANSEKRQANVGRSQDAATLTRWLQRDIFSDKDPPILHLHGDTSDPNEMIFTADDYDRFYGGSLFEQFIRQLWLSNRLLVIGFGFTDPFLTRTAETVLRSLPSDVRHFALIGKRQGEVITPFARRQFIRKFRLSPIFYEVRPLLDGDKGLGGEDHSDLLTLLGAISNQRQIAPAPQPIAGTAVLAPSSEGAVTFGGSFDLTPTQVTLKSEFERDLFVGPRGNVLYAEPALTIPGNDQSFPALEEATSIKAVVEDLSSYVIACPPEYGATTLARRLASELSNTKQKCVVADAATLPNYQKKLREEFAPLSKADNACLVLDNFHFDLNERLLKEIVGLDIFSRLILLARVNLFGSSQTFPVDQLSLKFKIITLGQLGPSDIRVLTSQFFESSDADKVSTVVEKIYGDLLGLCIPITPSNVIMYLSILHKDGDFQPLNRVQIVDRFLSALLRHPSDLYRDAFTAANKLDVVSEFVFSLTQQNKHHFTEADWYLFCREHKQRRLSEFDERALLSELLSARVLLRWGSEIVFKYRFFFVFFLGRYIAHRPIALTQCVSSGSYLNHTGLVEVISEFLSDNSILVADIVSKLEGLQNEFAQDYIPEDFDPFADLKWPTNKDEEEKLWNPLAKRVAEGPRDPNEIDQIKRSKIQERKANNQAVVVENFDRLERRLFAYHLALTEALRNSDNLDGELKRRAVIAAFKSFFVIYQIAMVLAPELMKTTYFYWHGLTFINSMTFDDKEDETRRLGRLMAGFRSGVVRLALSLMASRKLGEVFKIFARDKSLAPFIRLLNYRCLVRAKPKDWLAASSETVANVDRQSNELRFMLRGAFVEYNDEINTTGEREELKRLIATIRIKRDMKKDNPGERTIATTVGKLEKNDYFEQK